MRCREGAGVLAPIDASQGPGAHPVVECSAGKGCNHRTRDMLDILMLAIGLGFFAVSIGYLYACDRL